MTMHENDLSAIVRDCCFKINRKLGPGLFESVYERILIYELSQYDLLIENQKPISLTYGEITLSPGFRADIILENKLIIEIKSVESISAIHLKQLLTYLKLTKMKLGLLINFNSTHIKNGIVRVVNNLEE